MDKSFVKGEQMLIRETIWNVIRGEFSDDEKAEMITAVEGEAICPKGFIIDDKKLSAKLREKIRRVTAVKMGLI